MAEHETKKPILRVLAGEIITPQPVWLMRQAGRYLSEYRQLRAKAGDFMTLCFTPELAAEVTLQPIKRFGFDGAILFSDILVIPHALGQKLWFEEGEGPKLSPLNADELSTLKIKAIRSSLAPVFETIAKVKSKLPPTIAMLGFAGAPWTVANYMIAGGSSDESMHIRKFAYAHPQALTTLIDILVEATTEYLIAQVEAGAEALQIFESWAGTIPATQVHAFSIEPIQRMIAGVRKKAPSVPIIVFPRGAGANYIDYGKETGATAISVDFQTPLKALKAQLGAKTILQGNLDPLALIAGGSHLQNAVSIILDTTKDTPHIFNLGHGIRPETPPEHVDQLLGHIRNRT